MAYGLSVQPRFFLELELETIVITRYNIGPKLHLFRRYTKWFGISSKPGYVSTV